MPVIPFHGKLPRIHPTAFVAPNAYIIGDVVIGPGSSIWYGVVIRGDVEPITIGSRTNIQDGSVLHTDRGHPLVIGDEVTIGHMACVHGCVIGRRALVGIGASVLTGAILGEECVVGAGALVPEHKHCDDRALMVGVPARKLRDVSDEELSRFERGMAHYIAQGARHAEALREAESLELEEETLDDDSAPPPPPRHGER